VSVIEVTTPSTIAVMPMTKMKRNRASCRRIRTAALQQCE
jgi:hypothetical protein